MRSVAVVLALTFVLGGTVAAAQDTSEERFVGRPLAEVLKELQRGGLRLVFSSDLVTPELVVKSEPRSKSPRERLRELLAPFDLTIQDGPGSTIMIVRRERPESVPTSSIRGIVREARTDVPLTGARVEVLGTEIRVLTGDDGRFEVPALEVGTYTLEVDLPGYLGQQIEHVRLLANRPSEVVFRLLPSPELVEAIVVTPSTYGLYGDSPDSRKTLGRQEIEQTPTLADDPNRVVARLPGMANPDISSTLHVRGGADDELLMVVDGMELYAPYHFEPVVSMFSVVNSRAIEQADVFTGGFSARYGNRMSGVIDFSSVNPQRRMTNNLGVSFVNAYFTTEGMFGEGRGEWMAAVRRGYLDVLLRVIGEDQGEDLKYGDVLAKVKYRVGDRTTIGGSVLNAVNDADFLENSSILYQSIVGEQSNEYAWATMDTAWNPGLFSRTMLYSGRLGRKSVVEHSRYQDSAVAHDDRSVGLWGVKQDWNLSASSRNFLQLGFDAKRLDADYDFYSFSENTDPVFIGIGPPVVTERDADFAVSGWNYAVYATDRIRVARPLTVEVGLRWDRQTYTGFDDQISPRFNLLYQPTERDAFRASWGVFGQSQGIHELQVQDGINEFHPAQRTVAAVVGYEHRFESGLGLGVEIYHKDMTSLWPRFENMFHTREGVHTAKSDRILVAPTQGRGDGIELTIRQDGTGRFRWWASYVLSRVDDEIDGAWVPRSWDQRHAASFNFNYRIGESWNFNAAAQYHTGWPTTPVTAELVQNSDGSYDVLPEIGERNSIRYADYHRLDVRASRDFVLRRSRLTLFVEVINLLASVNPCCGDDFGYTVRPDGSVDVHRYVGTWMPLIPSFGVNWQF